MVELPRFAPHTPLPAEQVNALASETERAVAGVFGDLITTTRPAFRVQLTSPQEIPPQDLPGDTGDRIVVWDTSTEDTDGMWSSLAPEVIDVHTGGLWCLIAVERWGAGTTGSRAGKILLNGPDFNADAVSSAKLPAAGSAFPGRTLMLQRFIRLAAGDVLRLNCWQNSGAPLNLEVNFGGTWFAGVWMSP